LLEKGGRKIEEPQIEIKIACDFVKAYHKHFNPVRLLLEVLNNCGEAD